MNMLVERYSDENIYFKLRKSNNLSLFHFMNKCDYNDITKRFLLQKEYYKDLSKVFQFFDLSLTKNKIKLEFNKVKNTMELKLNKVLDFDEVECKLELNQKKIEKDEMSIILINEINEIKNKKEENVYLDINEKEIITLIETQHSFVKFLINFGTSESKKEIFDILDNSINKFYDLLSSMKSFNQEKNQISISNYVLNNDNMRIIFDFLNDLVLSPILISEFQNFPNLMKFLNTTYFYELSLSTLNNITTTYNLGKINTSEKCKKLIEFIDPIIRINHAELREYLSNKIIYRTSKIVFIPSSKDPYEQLDMLQMIKNSLINSTKNDNEPLTEKKKLIYLTNCLNALFLLSLNIGESYDNIIKNKDNKQKKIPLHLDFCNNYNFKNKNFNIKKEETFLPFYTSYFKEIDSIFEHIKYISSEDLFKLYIECVKTINAIKFEDIDKYEDYAYIYINKAIDLLIVKWRKNQKGRKC